MGEGFGLVGEQKHDVARLGLRLEQCPAQASAVHGITILAAFQRVARTPPVEVPFWRSTTETREGEIWTTARVACRSASRARLRCARSASCPGKWSGST